MIGEYLDKKKREEEDNTPFILKAPEGELWNNTLYIDDQTALVVFKSGNGLILWNNGAKKILNKPKTDIILAELANDPYTQSRQIAQELLDANPESKARKKGDEDVEPTDTKTTI